MASPFLLLLPWAGLLIIAVSLRIRREARVIAEPPKKSVIHMDRDPSEAPLVTAGRLMMPEGKIFAADILRRLDRRQCRKR